MSDLPKIYLGRKPSIAVFPFKGIGGKGISKEIARYIARYKIAGFSYRIIGGKFPEASLRDKDEMCKLAKSLEIEYIILGEVKDYWMKETPYIVKDTFIDTRKNRKENSGNPVCEKRGKGFICQTYFARKKRGRDGHFSKRPGS